MSLLLTICVLHFIAQLSPDPDILLIAKSAAATSCENSLKIILGISFGIVIWVCLTLLGFTVLIEQFPWIQQLLMLIGGLFLAKMGWAMFNAGMRSLNSSAYLAEVEHLKTESAQNYFLLGLLTN